VFAIKLKGAFLASSAFKRPRNKNALQIISEVVVGMALFRDQIVITVLIHENVIIAFSSMYMVDQKTGLLLTVCNSHIC